MDGDRIEILSSGLLDSERGVVAFFKDLARRLDIGLGWHYLLDLAWTVSELNKRGLPRPGRRILDAGAGLGLLQWYLAEAGAEVLSVDRNPRTLPASLRSRYRVRGMRPQDLPPPVAIARRIKAVPRSPGAYVRAIARAARTMLRALAPPAPGRVILYHHDLTDLPQIPADSVDAVVSVSALEHNDPGQLPEVVGELMRTLKPGGVMLATLGAARDFDWFHEPSRGWNYTEESLRQLFCLAPKAPSNYGEFDELFAALKNCRELRDNLAPMYFLSGDNGMPWGKWNPQYQPVAVRKIKRTALVPS